MSRGGLQSTDLSKKERDQHRKVKRILSSMLDYLGDSFQIAIFDEKAFKVFILSVLQPERV